MSIALKSKASGTDAGASATVSVTTAETVATAVGDLVLIIYANDFYAITNMGTPAATGSPTMNAVTAATADGGASGPHIKVYWYVANTAGAQTISATETGTHDEDKALFAFVFSGADTTTPIDGTPANTVGTASPTNVAPATSPAGSNSYLVTALANDVGKTYTTPAPLTEQLEIGISIFLDLVAATEQLSASGSTGTFTFTPSGSCAYIASTLTLKTASGGSSVTATVTMAGAGTLGASSPIDTIPAGVVLTGSGALAATGKDTIPTSVIMAGAGSLTAAGVDTIPAPVTMAGVGTLGAAIGGTETATVTLAGAGTLSAAPTQVVIISSLQLVGGGTLTVTARVGPPGRDLIVQTGGPAAIPYSTGPAVVPYQPGTAVLAMTE